MSDELRDNALIEDAMRVLAKAPLDAAALDAQRTWLRAQVLRRAALERDALAPIELGSVLTAAAASLAALGLALQDGGQMLRAFPLTGAVMVAGFIAAGLTAGALAWRR